VISTRPCPQACTISISVLLCQVLQDRTGLHQLCFTVPCPTNPAQDCWISALLGHAPKPAMLEIHTHDLYHAGQCPPGLHKPTQYPLHKPASLRSAKPGTHTGTFSVLQASTLGLWDSTHLPLATGRLQTYLRDTHTQVWMLKN
jgi:hypothetical protein